MARKVLTSEIMADVAGSEPERLEQVLAALGTLETRVRFSNGQHSRIERRWLMDQLRSIRLTGRLPTGKVDGQ